MASSEQTTNTKTPEAEQVKAEHEVKEPPSAAATIIIQALDEALPQLQSILISLLEPQIQILEEQAFREGTIALSFSTVDELFKN